jgi:hypothetical protein
MTARASTTIPRIHRRITLWEHPLVYGVRAIRTGPRLWSCISTRWSTMFRSHLTTSASFRGISTGSQTPPPKRLGRRGRSADGFYADIAEFAKQAHRDRHRTYLSVCAAIAAKRDVTPEVANSGAPAHVRPATFKRLGSKPKPRTDTTR